MDPVTATLASTIIISVVGGAAGQAGRYLYDWFKETISGTFKDKTDADAKKALDEIGNLADSVIRKRVHEIARHKKLAQKRPKSWRSCLSTWLTAPAVIRPVARA